MEILVFNKNTSTCQKSYFGFGSALALYIAKQMEISYLFYMCALIREETQ